MKNNKRSGKSGAKSGYSPKTHPKALAALIKVGYRNKELAELLGISESTFYRWRKRYPQFRETYERGLAEAKERNGRARTGSPSKYNPDIHPMLLRELLSADHTIEEVCDRLKVSTTTFYIWVHKHPEFRDAYNHGLAERDGKAERALFKLITGFSYRDGDKVRTVLPDFRAIKFYLINRGRYKPESAFASNSEVDNAGEWDPRGYTTEELRAIIRGDLSE